MTFTRRATSSHKAPAAALATGPGAGHPDVQVLARTSTRRAPRRRVPAVLVVGVLLATSGLAGCGSNIESEILPVEAPPDLADLRPYLGKQVTVTAEVAGLQSPRAFTIIKREGAGGEPLLVVHEARDPVDIDEDLPITVTGTVGVFDAQQNLVGRQDPARLTQFDGEPYIEADALVVPQPD